MRADSPVSVLSEIAVHAQNLETVLIRIAVQPEPVMQVSLADVPAMLGTIIANMVNRQECQFSFTAACALAAVGFHEFSLVPLRSPASSSRTLVIGTLAFKTLGMISRGYSLRGICRLPAELVPGFVNPALSALTPVIISPRGRRFTTWAFCPATCLAGGSLAIRP